MLCVADVTAVLITIAPACADRSSGSAMKPKLGETLVKRGLTGQVAGRGVPTRRTVGLEARRGGRLA